MGHKHEPRMGMRVRFCPWPTHNVMVARRIWRVRNIYIYYFNIHICVQHAANAQHDLPVPDSRASSHRTSSYAAVRASPTRPCAASFDVASACLPFVKICQHTAIRLPRSAWLRCGLGFRVVALPNPMNRLAGVQRDGFGRPSLYLMSMVLFTKCRWPDPS